MEENKNEIQKNAPTVDDGVIKDIAEEEKETLSSELDGTGKTDVDITKKELITAGKKTRKRIIIAFGGLFALGVVSALLLNAINNNWFSFGKKGEESTTKKPHTIIFHETYPEAFNIFEYDEYMELNRNVYYTDVRMGTTTVVEENKVFHYGESFEVLYNMIQYAIAGNWKEYNAILSDELQKDAGEFTQQQIYKIEISPFRETYVEGENGRSYEVSVFKVSYMIHENNGTLRTDIGSDEARIQYYTFSNESGKFRLIAVANQNYK